MLLFVYYKVEDILYIKKYEEIDFNYNLNNWNILNTVFIYCTYDGVKMFTFVIQITFVIK